jgi:hypothetical protein
VIEQLFGSKTRVKLLQLFYSNPNRSFYVREITRKIDEQINSVRRELANLLSIGIISSDTTNNRLYYEVDQTFGHYQPLAAIFGSGSMPKTASAPSAPEEQSALQSLGNMSLAVLTGQLTRDDRSGIDVLLVGDLNQSQVANYISDMEGKEGKELRYVVMNDDEFRYRQEVNDRFLALVLGSKMQVVIDKNYLITPKPVKKKPASEEKEEENKAAGKNGGSK